MNPIIQSPTAKKMASYILPLWLDNKEIASVLEAVGRDRDDIDDKDYDTFLQFFPQTATWGLKYHERSLGIPVNETLPLETRRNRVMARKKLKNPVNPKRVQTAVMQITNMTANVFDHFAECVFGVEIYQEDNAPVNLVPVIRELKRIKPSGRGFQLILNEYIELTIVREVLIRYAEYLFCGDFVCGEELP